MDSLTQILLGAAVGKLAGGKKFGNIAALWGAIGGTVPDLDVIMGLIYDPVSYLMIHRGFSHSIFFAPLTAPIFALLPLFLHKSKFSDYKVWVMVFFWALFTHPFLDVFTGYGTQLLNPFSNYGFEINSLFIIDPIYTITLGSFLVVALFKNNKSRYNQILAKGLIITSTYIALTVGFKLYSQQHIKHQAKNQGIEIKSMMTIPGPLSSFLWRGLLETEEGFYQTYFSIFDSTTDDLNFHYTPKGNPYTSEFYNSRAVKTLKWFSKGYYIAQYDSTFDEYRSYDLRFGSALGWDGDYDGYIFTFYVFRDENGEILFSQRPNSIEITGNDLYRLVLRTFSLHK